MTRRFVSAVAGPAERGREFGAAHAGEVAATIAGYHRLFAAAYGAEVDLDGFGELALERIDGWAGDLGEEIRGIAAGAGIPAVRVAAINARTEIIAQLRLTLPECSAVVALRGPGEAAVAAQNWDWYSPMADNWLEWTIPFPDGRRVTTLTEYGLVGKIGVNDAGLGVLFTMLHHRDDGAGLGVPVHVVARRVLDQARDVAAARAICASARTSASTSVTIVGGDAAVSVELWPGGPSFHAPDERGLLIRTNHFLTPEALDGDLVPAEAPSTLIRYDALRRHLRGRDVTAEDVFDALADHSGGVCSHPLAQDPADLRHATLATVLLDLAEGRLVVSDGTPCRAERPLWNTHGAQRISHSS